MTIKKKLTVAFVGIALFVAILGGLVTFFSFDIEGQVDEIGKNNYVKIQSSSEVKYHIQHINTNIRETFLELDIVIIEKHEAEHLALGKVTVEQHETKHIALAREKRLDQEQKKESHISEIYSALAAIEESISNLHTTLQEWEHTIKAAAKNAKTAVTQHGDTETGELEALQLFKKKLQEFILFLHKIIKDIRQFGNFTNADKVTLLHFVSHLDNEFHKYAKPLSQELLALATKLGKRAEQEMAQELLEIREDARRGTLFSLLLTLLAFIAAVITGIMLSLRISRPIEQLQTIATQLGKGEFDPEITIESQDESG